MPLVDSNSAAVWDSLYQCSPKDGGGQIYHFDRIVKDRILGNDHWSLLTALQTKGITKGQKICLLGAGFGWVAEDWVAQGWTPLIAVDTSTYIASRKATEATVTIYDYDITTGSGRNAIKQALGVTGNNKVNWMISEDVLPILSDTECGQLDGWMHDLGTNVAHWVSVLNAGSNQDVRLNWKTLAQWKALMPSSWVVSRGATEIL